ncbi:enoyl-CoA hydratase/isomerase family protein [Sporolactobacillus sp. KGMB 08714]|uniref:enoyl-CoA hydratase/isomerase family protein n=1 Tax=Sporolactobacillus sp. KGMB 08714 TaxID=3064704 RepID=UPI002FBEA2DC
MSYEDIIYEVKDNVALITINRPKVLNALRTQTKEELENAIDTAAADEEVRGMIITGSGKGFIAGSDISEISTDKKGEETTAMSKKAHKLFNKFEEIGKPIIAAVNGYALGGGTELALACDLRIASSKAIFGLPEVDLGVAPCYGGTQRLPRLVGPGAALELLMTGKKISAQEAKEIGLVNKVVEHAELISEAEKMMQQIIKNAPIAVKYCKFMVNKGLQMSLKDGLDYEAKVNGILVETEDAKEGVKAFFDKRKPVFKNK